MCLYFSTFWQISLNMSHQVSLNHFLSISESWGQFLKLAYQKYSGNRLTLSRLHRLKQSTVVIIFRRNKSASYWHRRTKVKLMMVVIIVSGNGLLKLIMIIVSICFSKKRLKGNKFITWKNSLVPRILKSNSLHLTPPWHI